MSINDPEPLSSSTFIAQTLASGATPTTPIPLSDAAAVPATCVPCPCPSTHPFGAEFT